ncbi:hypothetical protein FUA37_19100, partial [Salmonella enterica]|nr:hypothetical protein [Salmonella enterica]EKF2373099.1 YadA-like family protein [Salmonella enterica]
DGLIQTEQAARTQGNADTLAAATSHSDANLATAKGYTDTQVTASNARTDGLIQTEQAARTQGNADTLAAATSHSDANLTTAQGYTDTQVTASNTRTDGLIQTEQAAREKGNAETLHTANLYTDQKVRSVNADGVISKAKNYTDESARQTLNNANTYTDHRATQAENNAVARSQSYTNSRFGELKQRLDKTERRLNAGIAGVTAISSIPYVSENNVSWGIGGGNYQNGNALAAGVQLKMSPNTNVRLNVSWDSAGNSAAGVGFAGGW